MQTAHKVRVQLDLKKAAQSKEKEQQKGKRLSFDAETEKGEEQKVTRVQESEAVKELSRRITLGLIGEVTLPLADISKLIAKISELTARREKAHGKSEEKSVVAKDAMLQKDLARLANQILKTVKTYRNTKHVSISKKEAATSEKSSEPAALVDLIVALANNIEFDRLNSELFFKSLKEMEETAESFYFEVYSKLSSNVKQILEKIETKQKIRQLVETVASAVITSPLPDAVARVVATSSTATALSVAIMAAVKAKDDVKKTKAKEAEQKVKAVEEKKDEVVKTQTKGKQDAEATAARTRQEVKESETRKKVASALQTAERSEDPYFDEESVEYDVYQQETFTLNLEGDSQIAYEELEQTIERLPGNIKTLCIYVNNYTASLNTIIDDSLIAKFPYHLINYEVINVDEIRSEERPTLFRERFADRIAQAREIESSKSIVLNQEWEDGVQFKKHYRADARLMRTNAKINLMLQGIDCPEEETVNEVNLDLQRKFAFLESMRRYDEVTDSFPSYDGSGQSELNYRNSIVNNFLLPGLQAYTTKNYLKAAIYLTIAMEQLTPSLIDPESQRIRFSLQDCAMNSVVISYFKEIGTNYVRAIRGAALSALGKHKEALPDFLYAIKDDEFTEELLKDTRRQCWAQSMQCFNQKKYQEAIDLFTLLLSPNCEYHPDDRKKLVAARAIAMFNTGKFLAVLPDLKYLQDLAPSSLPDLKSAQLNLAFYQQMYNDAIRNIIGSTEKQLNKELAIIEDMPQDAYLEQRNPVCAEKARKIRMERAEMEAYGKVIENLTRVIELEPKMVSITSDRAPIRVRELRGKAFYKQGKFIQAYLDFNALQKLVRGDKEIQRTLNELLTCIIARGCGSFAEKDYVAAQNDFDFVLEQNPKATFTNSRKAIYPVSALKEKCLQHLAESKKQADVEHKTQKAAAVPLKSAVKNGKKISAVAYVSLEQIAVDLQDPEQKDKQRERRLQEPKTPRALSGTAYKSLLTEGLEKLQREREQKRETTSSQTAVSSQSETAQERIAQTDKQAPLKLIY